MATPQVETAQGTAEPQKSEAKLKEPIIAKEDQKKALALNLQNGGTNVDQLGDVYITPS